MPFSYVIFHMDELFWELFLSRTAIKTSFAYVNDTLELYSTQVLYKAINPFVGIN